MPLLRIQTNVALAPGAGEALIRGASSAVAAALGKPERYVMVILDAAPAMLFAGTSEPAAFLELRSIGLPGKRTEELSAVLTELATTELGVAGERVYINFQDVPRHLWGWNAGTF